ncbi:hypothetical protein NHQ30_007483 [Ciborinia camelliae]|nr:hypothetical protein NHQ30_007483 [Ciborinia camelliae]
MYHGLCGSSHDRSGYGTNVKFPAPGKSRSRRSSTDGPGTLCSGRMYRDYKTFYRSKPAVTSALRCLVGKFEAMDALSLPIQDLTLQPAPLHSARNSPRKRSRTRDSSQKRLSTILSPTIRSLSNEDDVFIDEYLENNTWEGTPSSTKSTRLRSSSKKQFQPRQLRTPRQSITTKTPLKSENQIIPPRSTSNHRSVTKVEVPAYILPKKSPNKKIGKMIKDRIRFFDGSPDEKAPTSPSKTSPPKIDLFKAAPNHNGNRHNAESSPASWTTGARTPIFKVPAMGSTNFSRTSELAREKSTISSPVKSQYSPPTSRKQRKFFGEAVQNPFLTSQGSSEKATSSTAISPHSSPTKTQPFCRLNSEPKADTSTRGRSLARYELNNTPTRSSEMPKISRPRGRTIPGRKDLKTGMQKDVDTRRNQISEKIEAIYQAKSEVRKAQIQGNIAPEESYEASPMPKNDGKEDDIRQSQRIQDSTSFRSKSKVADMRMRFDGGASFASTVLPGSATKEAERRTVSPIKEGGSSTIPTPPPPPPPPIFSARVCRKNNNSPKHSIPVPRNPSPKFPTPRKQTPSKTLLQRVSTLPLEKQERAAMPGRQQTPRRKSLQRLEASPMASQQFEKSALQTWPRSGIKRPKQIRNGLIADKLKMFEEISKKNDSPFISPGKEKKKEIDSSKHIATNKIPRTLVDGRKECFEISPTRDEDGNDKKSNPVFPMAIVAIGAWKGKGKEDEKDKEGKIGGDGDDEEVTAIPPTRKAGERKREGSKGPRLGSRKHVMGKHNEVLPMMGEGDGEALGHLPVKRGLRDGRMHMGRDGSDSIDLDEVGREIEWDGSLVDEVMDFQVLVGRGKGMGGIGNRIRDVSTSSELSMVFKEAECGLTEPKPRRAVEMKRMVDICRDRERVEERERSRGRKLERRKEGEKEGGGR